MKTFQVLVFFKHILVGERSRLHSSGSPFYHQEDDLGGVITVLVSKSCIKGAETVGCWQGLCRIFLMLEGKKC